MTNSDSVTITHFVPDVGPMLATLHGRSASLYRALNERAEIDRQQALAQLGVVQLAWQMARHSRWDFSMVLLDLLRRAGGIPRLHVASQVKLSDGLVVSSGVDLMSSWTLMGLLQVWLTVVVLVRQPERLRV